MRIISKILVQFQFQDWAKLNKDFFIGQYDTVYNGAESSRESLKWAHEVRDDFMNYFKVSGILEVTRTGSFMDKPPATTIVPSNLEEHASPDLLKRSSAATTYVSMLALAFVAIANYVTFSVNFIN